MDEIQQLLVDAWGKVFPKVLADPGELERRLARGKRLKMLRRPPRAWCLAVRACDTRLWAHATKRPDREYPNQVVLDAKALRELCGLVRIETPGQTVEEVAEMLGVTRKGLRWARVKGLFRMHHIPARWGHPRPLLYCEHELDPSIKGFLPPEPGWSYTATEKLELLPDDFCQILTRVPKRFEVRRWRDTEGLHPEHPERDGRPPRRSEGKLAPPAPDYVWYKWKGDQYMGYDWRSPLAEANYKKRQAKLKRLREASRRWRQKRPYQYDDPMRFEGYWWECPVCGKEVKVVFLPMIGLNLLQGYLGPFEADERIPTVLRFEVGREGETKRMGFACEQCHGVKRTSRGNADAWNQLVTYMTCGLLYGKEVRRPSWFPEKGKVQRRREYRPRVGSAPSKRRPQIEQMLLEGKRYKEIARELGISYFAVAIPAQDVFKQHGVRTLGEFLAKHGKERPMAEIRACLPHL